MEEMDFELTIQSLAYGGWGVGRKEGKVVFVPLTAPGDVIRCAVVQDRGRFAFGTLVDLIHPSPARVAAPCPVFGRCGGCQWQHIGYERQLEAKRDILVDAFSRIGRLGDTDVCPTVGSRRAYGWRTAVDLAFGSEGGDIRVGFHSRHGSEIVPIAGCPVATDEINARIGHLPEAIAAAGLVTDGEIRLVAGIDHKVSAHLMPGGSAAVRRHEAQRFTDAAALSGLEVTTKRGTSAFGDPVITYPGWDGTKEVGLFCRPSGFVQANPDVNRELIDRLLSCDVTGKNVLELYCGMGNLTVPMATAEARVTAVESSRTSVADARKTAETIGLSGITFVAGTAKDVVSDPSIQRIRYDVIVLDPPRTGARSVVERIRDLQTSEILYISCSPPTLARDLAVLAENGWRLLSIVPLDMFPQTFHTETLCRLGKE